MFPEIRSGDFVSIAPNGAYAGNWHTLQAGCLLEVNSATLDDDWLLIDGSAARPADTAALPEPAPADGQAGPGPGVERSRCRCCSGRSPGAPTGPGAPGGSPLTSEAEPVAIDPGTAGTNRNSYRQRWCPWQMSPPSTRRRPSSRRPSRPQSALPHHTDHHLPRPPARTRARSHHGEYSTQGPDSHPACGHGPRLRAGEHPVPHRGLLP